MIKKRSLWYLFLFSVTIALCVYYVSIPNDLLTTIDDATVKDETIETIDEASSLVALRVNLQEERQEEMSVLQKQLTDSSTEEKNQAYEKLKYLNKIQAEEEELEVSLKNNLDLDCFVKIDNTNINAVCISDDHNKALANSVMRQIQSNYKEKKYITVKFQKS